jgi:hypothetical protein
MLYLKIHNTESGDILAMCDSALTGRVLSEDEVEINLKDYSEFYIGRLMDPEGAHALIKSTRIMTANIVGEESVRVALKSGIIKRGHVKRVMGVPYANSFRVR